MQNIIEFSSDELPIGKVKISISQNKLSRIRFLSNEVYSNFIHSPLVDKINEELSCYFKNPNFVFNLDLLIEGTPFQKRVWQELQTIPSGKTQSYKELAIRLKTSPRAIGNACRANPIPLVIPCHRVVAKNGLGGFAGDVEGKLIKIKKWLLTHENSLSPD